MPTTTILSPATQAAIQAAGLGPNVVFGITRAMMAMQDRMDPSALGIIGLRGDAAGTGTETIRVTDIDDVGFSRRFTALGTETEAVTPSPMTLGYADVTVGLYGLSHSQTLHSQVIDRAMGHDIMSLMAMVPDSWVATVRYLSCVTGAGISGTVGSTTAALDVDAWLALGTYLRELPGSTALGMPRATLAPQQLTQLVDAFRSEPAYQTSVADFTSIQGIVGQMAPNFAGLGIDIATTPDVTQSGGAYQGFALAPGGIGWARASTAGVLPTGVVSPIYMPEIGVLIAPLASSMPNATALYVAWLWLGLALASTQTHAQKRILSVV